MSDPTPVPIEPSETRAAEAERKAAWWRRRWVTVGEIVGVAALVIAVLGYLDTHKQHADDLARRTVEAKHEQARAALILTAAADADGGRLTLTPLGAGQAVQGQRYLFPQTVLGHAMEVTAARPQIDRGWFEAGLKKALEAGTGPKTGEGVLPVGVVTRYIEDGEERTDRSLYRVGFAVRGGGLFSGRKLVLLGLSVVRRGVDADLQSVVDKAWAEQAAQGLAKEGGG